MKKLILFLSLTILTNIIYAQTIGTVKTEEYKGSFESKTVALNPNYNGPTIPIQLLQIGVTEDVYTMYPELKDKRVGLGLTNIVIEYLEETSRFTFTEEKAEIKNRMVNQFKASQAGISENKLDGRGKIKLAQYFVYIEIYDFSISEDEVLKLKDGAKQTLTTRLGLQIKFVDAETGEFLTGSGLGEASTVKEMTLMNDDNLSEVKFNQSTIGTTTKKALDIAATRIVNRLVKKGVFQN
jgi:hypothetical protein